MQFFLITFFVFAFDQLLKFFVNNFMRVNETIPIIENVLHLTYVQNKGAAFGLFWGRSAFLLIIGVFVIGAILHYHNKISLNDYLQIPLAFLLGGSLGNMFDRIFRSYVVDFIDFRVWPVFNLADIMINLGVFLVLIKLIQDWRGN